MRIQKLTLTNSGDFSGVVTLEAEAVIYYRSEELQSEAGTAGVVPRRAVTDDA